jgi:hypothetical protein
MTRHFLWVLWPSFLVAGAADGVVFSMFDPHDLRWFGEPVQISRMGAYTIGFFFLWLACSVASALCLWLGADRNRKHGSHDPRG